MTQLPETVVIGGGIVGVCAAIWLQRDGCRVTLIDPGLPGSGASEGNAGCFSPSSIVPLSAPGLLRQVPRWLLDPGGPLALRWRYLPHLAPWLWRFIRAGAPDRVEHQAGALSRLLAPVQDSLGTLLRGTGAEALVKRHGSLITYRTEAGWLAGRGAWELRRHNGITWRELDAGELHALEPALAPGLHRGVLLPGNGHTVDPHALVIRLADAFRTDGGTVLARRATGFDVRDGRLHSVLTTEGPLPASRAVLAAGVHSRPLARGLGDRVPLETERGYHLTVPGAGAMLGHPVLAADDRFVATPMTPGLRLTGTVELAGLAAPPNWRRAHALLPLAQRLLPGLATDAGAGPPTVWMGHRPSMPDSLPVIGRSTRTPDVIYAFGHGHLGLTAAPFTGQLVAALVQDRSPAIDLAPYAPARFRAAARHPADGRRSM